MSASVGVGWSVEEVLAGFDDHLRRARGVCAGTRSNYARFACDFLEGLFPDGLVVVERISAGDVVGFIGVSARRYSPRTVELVATSLRSLFRFLRAEGLVGDRLEAAVPMVPHRRSGLVRHLDPASLEQLIDSLDSSTERGLRDRAMILCMARLGLRASEVVRLRLDDIDWRAGLVRIVARKTGHGAILPMTDEVGAALVDYLQRGRPHTTAREVFILVGFRRGAPISDSIVGRAVDNALRRAGIEAATRGGNLLRHSLATGLQARGVGLSEIADLLGHSRLATTRIYAAVDIAALREVALPWPGATTS
jgi:integrase/recombinase XerD